MTIISKIITYIRSFFFCIKYLPLEQAIHVPICVASNVKHIKISKGGIRLNSPIISKYQVILGMGGSVGLQAFQSGIYIDNSGVIIFNGRARISEGSVLRVEKGAMLEIGDIFYCNKNCYIRCSRKIKIGKEVLLGWNISFNDTNGHTVLENGIPRATQGEIEIGNHIWITSNCTIGKGSKIPDNCIIAQGAVIVKEHKIPNSLIGGIPAKEIRSNINWQY